MRLYLDMETYREKDAFIDEKIIAIGIIEDWTSYNYSNVNNVQIKQQCFAEWVYGNENKIICNFYKKLKELKNNQQKKNRSLEVIGFNILRFDIPLLIQKGFKLGLGEIDELNKLWHETFVRDYFQICLPLNNMMFKGLKLKQLVERLKGKGINIPEPYGSGGAIAELYKNKKYDEIIKHLYSDLHIIRTIDLNYKTLMGI